MKTVLLVEDDRWLAELYTDALQKWCHVIHAYSPFEAFDVLEKTKIDVIVLDMFLPFVNGIAFLQELRSHTKYTQLPVVLCSSVEFTKQQKAAFEAFAVSQIFHKPTMRMRDLAAAVEAETKK